MIHISLLVLNVFLALTAFAGGIGIIAGLNAPPIEALSGSPFHDYTIPGLALFLLVGGSALAAAIAAARKHPLASISSIIAGMMIVGFEVVEVMVIGSPPGIARTLQILYFTVGLLLAAFAIAQRVGEQRKRFDDRNVRD